MDIFRKDCFVVTLLTMTGRSRRVIANPDSSGCGNLIQVIISNYNFIFAKVKSLI